MGCSISLFKKFCQRIKRPKRDRWIRDETRRLLLLPDDARRPRYGGIPKRIEQQVIEDIVNEDLPRRLPDNRPGWNIYEEYHRQVVASFYGHHREASSAEGSSSKGNEGEERVNEGMAGRDVDETASEAYNTPSSSSSCESSSSCWNQSRVPADIRRVMPGGRDYGSVERMMGEYRRQMAEEGGQYRDESLRGRGDAASYALQRYGVVVHSCDSADASWTKYV